MSHRKVTIVELIRRDGREPGGKRRKVRSRRWVPAQVTINQLIGKHVALRFVGKALFGSEKP